MDILIFVILYPLVVFLVEMDCFTPMELTTSNDMQKAPWWFI